MTMTPHCKTPFTGGLENDSIVNRFQTGHRVNHDLVYDPKTPKGFDVRNTIGVKGNVCHRRMNPQQIKLMSKVKME